MGCNSSKLERLPAVALCRERCKFVDEALRQSYALADAHVAHMHSLKTLPSPLLSFFHHFQEYSPDTTCTTNPPINGDDDAIIDSEKSPPSHSHSSSFSSDFDSDAHVLLHSDEESEPEDTRREIQLFTLQNQRRYDDDYVINSDTVTVSSAPDNLAFMHYVQPLSAPLSPPLPNYHGGYSASKPPSPPRSSAWDFLNFFEPYDRYHVPYSPSREADVATTEEEKVVIISSHEPQNEADDGKKGNGEGGKEKVSEAEKVVGVENKEAIGSMEKDGLVLKKKIEAAAAASSEECSNNSAKVKAGEGGLCERTKEIQILFERASDSGNSILEMLDVAKLRYHRKLAFNPYPAVSCKMMNVFIPSNPLAFKCMETSSLLGIRRTGFGCRGFDKDKGHGYGNLCFTLKRLCIWEKKLYHEVKAEEKLRILHQKKCRQLRRMSKKGADAQKVDSVKILIGVLATKMKISIQVVDKISNTISKLREEELWPQISRFILMFLGMWKDMVECYRCQYQEIAEAKTLGSSTFNNRKLGRAHIDAAIKLKSEVQNWNLSLSDWIHAQKCFVKALNGSLVRCLLYEPEEVPDGTTPFSPGKIGAPPVFVICNKWSRAVDNLSEKNVTEAVNGLMLRLNELLEEHILDLQQKLTLDKELERKVKMLEKQEQKMHKIVQARETKMHKIVQARETKMVPIASEETDDALLRGDALHHGDLVDTVSIESGLKQIFAAMERFTATAAGLYQELCQQINLDDNVLGEANKIH